MAETVWIFSRISGILLICKVMQLQSKVRRRRVVTFPRLIFLAICNLKKWHVEAKTTTYTDCHSFLTHETIRGSLKLELEPGKYNITIEFMFAGINMFWARLRLILA